MVTIRKGKMKDCRDLLTVYQGAHWDMGFTTVEQVKDIHRGIGFAKWGWLVAEIDDIIVGEILFHTEKNPVSKKLGIIDDIGVDVRYQKKQGIGRELVGAAEEVLKQKKVNRVYLVTPPEAYNFWMKVKYFARGTLQLMELDPKKIRSNRVKAVTSNEIKETQKIPKHFVFTNYSTPGKIIKLSQEILEGKQTGRMLEFLVDDKVVGIGVIVKQEDGAAEFAADATKRGEKYFDFVISKTAKIGSRLRVNSVYTIIPADITERYSGLGKWHMNRYRGIPVTKLI
jgi:predicted N-acetyltransferase YhbS